MRKHAWQLLKRRTTTTACPSSSPMLMSSFLVIASGTTGKHVQTDFTRLPGPRCLSGLTLADGTLLITAPLSEEERVVQRWEREGFASGSKLQLQGNVSVPPLPEVDAAGRVTLSAVVKYMKEIGASRQWVSQNEIGKKICVNTGRSLTAELLEAMLQALHVKGWVARDSGMVMLVDDG